MINLWGALDKKKYTPHLLIPHSGRLEHEAKNLGIGVDYCEVPKLRPGNIAGILKAFYKIIRLCVKGKIDIIHSYTPRNNILAGIVGEIIRVPVIWHERNMIFGDEDDISRKFQFFPKAVICNSNAVASRFNKCGKLPSKIKIVLNGVDTDRFRPGKINPHLLDKYGLHGSKVVGLLSNLGVRKKPENLIEVCPYILEKLPQTKFLIVGGEFDIKDHGRKKELEFITRNLGLSDHVIFTDFLTNVEEIIRVFDIGVAVTEKEACSRAILEMMSTGKSVVAFNTGGNPELINHNETGLLVQTGNNHKLAEAIVDQLTNSTKRKLMGVKARQRVLKHFSLLKNTEKTTKIYLELTG